MEHCGLLGLFSPGFPLLHNYYDRWMALFKKQLPKLAAHVSRETCTFILGESDYDYEARHPAAAPFTLDPPRCTPKGTPKGRSISHPAGLRGLVSGVGSASRASRTSRLRRPWSRTSYAH